MSVIATIAGLLMRIIATVTCALMLSIAMWMVMVMMIAVVMTVMTVCLATYSKQIAALTQMFETLESRLIHWRRNAANDSIQQEFIGLCRRLCC